MRVSRVFRFIIKFFLILLTTSMSVVSFLGGYSAVLILSDDENIKVPDGEIEFDFPSLTNLTEENIDNISVKIPFKINNAGFFNLEDLSIEMIINFLYEDITDNNKTKTVKIFEKTTTFDTIKSGEVYKDKYSADKNDFLIDQLNSTVPKLNYNGTLDYLADVSLSAKYSLKLLSFRVTIEDIKIGEGGI